MATDFSQCILVVPQKHRFTDEAIKVCEASFSSTLVIYSEQMKCVQPSRLLSNKPLILSYLNNFIFKNEWLDHTIVNFHPAPVDYPGRGGASFALYNCEKSYGATAHLVDSGIDSGEVLLCRRFPIFPTDTCDILFSKAEVLTLELLYEFTSFVKSNKELPPASTEKWKRKAYLRRDLDKLLNLDDCSSAEILKRIRATQHSQFPGPYITIEGNKFGFLPDRNKLEFYKS